MGAELILTPSEGQANDFFDNPIKSPRESVLPCAKSHCVNL